MPAWVPNYPMMWVDVSASLAAGLTYRALGVTAKDTVEFERRRDPDDPRFRPFSFNRERERAVLDAWRQHLAS